MNQIFLVIQTGPLLTEALSLCPVPSIFLHSPCHCLQSKEHPSNTGENTNFWVLAIPPPPSKSEERSSTKEGALYFLYKNF